MTDHPERPAGRGEQPASPESKSAWKIIGSFCNCSPNRFGHRDYCHSLLIKEALQQYDAALARAAAPAEVAPQDDVLTVPRKVLLKAASERDWWHREWHRSTGIPCAMDDYCPLTRRENAAPEFGAEPAGKVSGHDVRKALHGQYQHIADALNAQPAGAGQLDELAVHNILKELGDYASMHRYKEVTKRLNLLLAASHPTDLDELQGLVEKFGQRVQSFCFYWKETHRRGGCKERNGKYCVFCELSDELSAALSKLAAGGGK